MQQQAPALDDAKRALELNRSQSTTYVVLGRIDLAEGQARNALERFDQALKFEALNKADIHMYRGDAWRALGDAARARLDYEEAKKRNLGRYSKQLDERLASLPAQ